MKRHSIRLQDYDYSFNGMYFITICTQDRVNLFGTVENGAVTLNPYGLAIQDCWEWLFHQYPYIEPDEFAIMPNHFHGILTICDGRSGSRTAPTPAKRKPLGRLIGAFKTVSTKRINDMRNTPGHKLWQRNYYEHVIQNENELLKIQKYIQENPLKWELDPENIERAEIVV